MGRQLRNIFLIIMILGISPCNSQLQKDRVGFTPGSQKQYAENIEQRIERVVNGLLPNASNINEKASLIERISLYKTPGVSIAVVNDYEIEWSRGFGVCEWEKPEPITDTTLFQAASISKPMFALGIMRLVQEGRLDLDEDVNNYLKSWKVPANGSWQPKVILRQIFSHSAGLTVHGFPGYLRSDEIPTLVQILNGSDPSNTQPIFVDIIPGLQKRYAGGGTTVAQQLIIDVMGKPFPEIMQNLVLNPLKMEHSTYEQPLPKDWEEFAATAHTRRNQAVKGKWHVYPEMAAAGLWTTPSDLARAGIEVQRAVMGKSTFISQDIVNQMLTLQTDDNIGIGFFLDGEGDTVRFSHGGGNQGFKSLLTMYKNIGKGAVIMINSNQGQPIILEIERAIAQEYGWPDYFPKEKASPDPAQNKLQGYVGEYITKSNFQFVVTIEDDTLFLKPTGQPPIKLILGSGNYLIQFSLKVFNPKVFTDTILFSLEALDAKVLFEKTDSGEVTGFVLYQSEKQISAKRK